MICAACLRKLTATQVRTWHPWRLMGDTAWGLGGLLTALLFFYLVGRILLTIPTPFHDGTLWQTFGGPE